jgi:hypothetical protein
MGLKSKRVLFWRVRGVVTKDGAQVAGAEVEQTVLYKEEGRTPQVTVVSDGEGKFAFAEVSANEGQSYEGWNHGKKGKEANTEANAKPLRLVCELSGEPGVSGNSFGICRAVE